MKRILIATDLTANATNALGRAIRLSAGTGAALAVLHVADEADDSERCPSVHRRLRTEAEIMAEELSRAPIDLSVCISGGVAEAAILREAQRLDADLIVIGGHGSPRFRDAIFGTTGTHVVRHSDRPVLIVQNDHAIPYSKALVAMADVATSRLVEAARSIAPNAELHAVHAHTPSLAETFGGSAEIDRHELEEERALSKAIANGSGAGKEEAARERHATVRTGDPLSVMMKEAETIQPDLLVLGTRRRASFLSSNAVDAQFWCPHDILIVPEGAQAEA